MRPPKRGAFAIAATALLALALVMITDGCGDDDRNGGAGAYGGGAPVETAPSGSAGAGIVSVAADPELGEILVDGDGRTLYLFEQERGGKPACYGACASVWPPHTADGAPRARNGAADSMLETTQRADGDRQLTYNGSPLYTYVGDKVAGDSSGHGFEQFGAQWFAVTPGGRRAND